MNGVIGTQPVSQAIVSNRPHLAGILVINAISTSFADFTVKLKGAMRLKRLSRSEKCRIAS